MKLLKAIDHKLSPKSERKISSDSYLESGQILLTVYKPITENLYMYMFLHL